MEGNPDMAVEDILVEDNLVEDNLEEDNLVVDSLVVDSLEEAERSAQSKRVGNLVASLPCFFSRSDHRHLTLYRTLHRL